MKLAVILCLSATLLGAAYGVAVASTGDTEFFKGNAGAVDVAITCTFSDYAEDTTADAITWMKNDVALEIKDNYAYTPVAETTKSRDQVLKIKKEEFDSFTAGKTDVKYTCSGTQSTEKADIMFSVYVYDVAITPATPTVEPAGSIDVTCTVSGLKADGAATITWKDGSDADITNGNGGYTFAAVDFAANAQGSKLTIAPPATATATTLTVKCAVTATDFGKTEDKTEATVTVAKAKVMCDAPVVANGAVAPAGQIAVDAEYTVTCNANYKLDDAKVNKMKCTDDSGTGKLEPAEIKCVSAAMGLAGASVTLMLLLSYMLL